MKNQYFGDINDYRKYGLIRVLSGCGELSTGVCWMLTPDDGGSDGRKIEYLGKPEKWRLYDPALFDSLLDQIVVRQRREVDGAAESPGSCRVRVISRRF